MAVSQLVTILPNIQNRWRPASPSFKNRLDAGHQLGKKLLEMYGPETLRDSVLLGMVRGGVGIAEGVLEELSDLNLRIGLLVVRKIGLPSNREMGIGAIDEFGTLHFSEEHLKKNPGIRECPEMQAVIQEELEELEKRKAIFRENCPVSSLEGRKVIIVDDSIAGGLTMIAGFESIKKMGDFSSLIIGVPVSSQKALDSICKTTELSSSQFCVVTLACPPEGMYWDTDDFYGPTPLSALEAPDVLKILDTYQKKPNEEDS